MTKKIRSFVVRIFLNTTYCGQNVISRIYVKPQLDHKKNTWCWKVFSSVSKCRNELYLFHVQLTDYAQALPRTHNTNTARAARGANVKGGRHAYWSVSALAGLQDSRDSSCTSAQAAWRCRHLAPSTGRALRLLT